MAHAMKNGGQYADEQNSIFANGKKAKKDFYGEESEEEFEENEKNEILDEQFRMHDEFN